MRWKMKSRIQNAIALLPSSLSYSLYYWVQSHFGALRRVDPLRSFRAGVTIWKVLREAARSPAGGTFLEIGTGWRISMPLAFWLMGARKVATVDLNPYLREELVRDDIEYVRAHRDEIESLFEGYLQRDRLEELLARTA
ncbi:MAG TPA: hypothetical protein VM389_06575 [Phycisphaerae bacterium]|nr:hypothetical protein [Phycisphaerae bacterium]